LRCEVPLSSGYEVGKAHAEGSRHLLPSEQARLPHSRDACDTPDFGLRVLTIRPGTLIHDPHDAPIHFAARPNSNPLVRRRCREMEVYVPG